MANLSKLKREKMLAFINSLREQHKTDDQILIALGEIENEINSKKYGLVWEEHDENVDKALIDSIPVFTEVKEKEISLAEGEKYNFLLEGDNLHSLYLLEKTHKSKIGAIYIDPPYNTGKEDFIYNDKFIDESDGYKNSKWLSFMEKRLLIAKDLLSNDGVIFISIDDNEYAPLKMLCDDIFGINNCLSIHHLQVRYANKSLNERKPFQECLEYVLIYAKNAEIFDANRPVTEYSLEPFKFQITENTKPEIKIINGREVEIFRKGEWNIKKVVAGIDNLNQRYEIARFAVKENILINGWIEETISGTRNYDKRELGKLLKKVIKGDLIICAELSRLGRNLFMIMEILNICMTKECQVWTIKDNYRLGDDIQSKVLAFAFGLSAEIERNLISQRTKEALARKKAEGVVLGRPKGKKSSRVKLTGKEETIRTLLNEGVPIVQIAKIFRVNRMTVSKFISDQNLRRNNLSLGTLPSHHMIT